VDTAKAFTGVVEREDGLIILLDLDETVPRAISLSGSHNEGEGETDG
jgi:hypothetical protein